MGAYAIKLPDIGEGVAEAELVEWHVAVGDLVKEDDLIAAVMTDKATVEIPSAVSGRVAWLAGDVGDTIAVGSDLVRLDVAGEGNTASVPPPPPPPSQPVSDPAPMRPKAAAPEPLAAPPVAPPPRMGSAVPEKRSALRSTGDKPTASPSVRKRARDAGIDLRRIGGSGPAGRIVHEDVDAFLARGQLGVGHNGRRKDTSVKAIKVVGLRRRIAEKMALANARIPHITIVEEIDMTNLEGLREELNASGDETRPKLTLLPFVIKAIVAAVHAQPGFNAHYDDEAGIVSHYGGVHVGIATQTPNGLVVPVVRHAEANSLWDNAREIGRLSASARDASAEREELSGSTITITSLGPLGAIATTPIINHPEVAIVGINKMAIRPWWDGQQFVPRRMMNISCSFDHRVIDGWEAAVFVQKLRTLLEKPAMLFVESWPNG